MGGEVGVLCRQNTWLGGVERHRQECAPPVCSLCCTILASTDHPLNTASACCPPPPSPPLSLSHRVCIERSDRSSMTRETLLDMVSLVINNASLTVSVFCWGRAGAGAWGEEGKRRGSRGAVRLGAVCPWSPTILGPSATNSHKQSDTPPSPPAPPIPTQPPILLPSRHQQYDIGDLAACNKWWQQLIKDEAKWGEDWALQALAASQRMALALAAFADHMYGDVQVRGGGKGRAGVGWDGEGRVVFSWRGEGHACADHMYGDV